MAITQTIWTILDDDLALRMEKTVDPAVAAVGDTVEYTLTVTHAGGVDGDGALVNNPPVAGLDCPPALAAACTASGGAQCPAAPTVGDLQGAGMTTPVLPVDGGLVLQFQCAVAAP